MASDVAVANLSVIDYAKLLEQDEAEGQSLFQACRRWGFFYLCFSNKDGPSYLAEVNEMFTTSRQYFARPLPEKVKDTREDFETFNICGYKPMGLDTGNVQHKKDGCEGLRIPSDLCHGVTENRQLSIPAGVRRQWPSLKRFTVHSHEIALTVLRSLSQTMGLEHGSRFENFHDPMKTSTTTTVLQCYPLEDLPPDVSVGHFTHTDTGSITILYNTEWGLQVHSPDTGAWEYIPPHPEYAIVNIGDTLKFMSKQTLRSSLHRVVPSSGSVGRWTSGPRYATIFFLRANDDAEFVDSEGNRWTAKAWLQGKFGGYRNTHDEQAKTAVSTGKIGFTGLWVEAQ